MLAKEFQDGQDYGSNFAAVQTAALSHPQNGGQNKQIIHLTIDAAKSFMLMANTEQGKAIRHYFIDCERKWRKMKAGSEFPQQLGD